MELNKSIEYKKSKDPCEIYTESSAEYVLPDYKGEVKKILFTSASAHPAGKFAGGESVEFSGIVEYKMVYLDSENNIESTTFNSDYDFSVKCSAENYLDSFFSTAVSNYAMRLVGPRKVSAKAGLISNVRICENASITVDSDSTDEDIEVLSRNIKMRSSVSSGTTERELAEQIISLEGAICDEVSVIHCTGIANVENISVGADFVNVCGEVLVEAVIKNGDEPAFLAQKNIPFDERVAFEKEIDDSELLARVEVASLTTTVNASAQGSEIVCVAIIELSCVAEKNDLHTLAEDAFVKSCPSENKYSDFSYTELRGVFCEHSSHSFKVPRAGTDTRDIREVVFVCAEYKSAALKKENGKVQIPCEVKLTGIASEINDDGSVSYSPLKFNSEFVKNVNVDCQNPDNLCVEIKIKPIKSTASIDANDIYINCEYDIEAVFSEKKSMRALEAVSAKKEEAYAPSVSKVIVYYPEESETLFSVSKKFHKSPVKISVDNSLSEQASSGLGEALCGVKRLIIL